MQQGNRLAVDADFVAVDVHVQRVVAVCIGAQTVVAEGQGQYGQQATLPGVSAVEEEFAARAVQLGGAVRRREKQREEQAAA